MALVVAKFGGSSVATPERVKNVARRLVRRHKSGDQVVAVVSAMGDNTDHLLDLAHSVNPDPPAREMDMLLATGEQVSVAVLAMAVQALGVPAVSHTGAQVGIVTDPTHTSAKIDRIVGMDRVKRDLDEGNIVIVAGFQGVNAAGEITTLGRGGSETPAMALFTAIGADFCEIYSDVDGVYTADPRICPKAHRVDRLSYDEMLELSANGAGVLQLRAVEFASKYGVVIRARSTFLDDSKGTIIEEAPDRMEYTEYSESAVLSGIAHDLSEAKVTLRHVPDRAGIAAIIFGRLGELGVNVDIIIQDISHEGLTDISFTTPINGLELPGRRGQDVQDAGRQRHQHLDDLHLAHLHLHGHRRRPVHEGRAGAPHRLRHGRGRPCRHREGRALRWPGPSRCRPVPSSPSRVPRARLAARCSSAWRRSTSPAARCARLPRLARPGRSCPSAAASSRCRR